jgi:uncharacterized protein
MAISDEKYVASTTYRKSGVAVPTQTWICAMDGSRVGFWTSSASGKYKRLRNNPSITLQAADARGRVKPGSPRFLNFLGNRGKSPYGDVGVVSTVK